MKRIYIFILITKCVSFLFSYQVIENNFSPDNSTKNRYEIVAYSEDFESGAPGWTHYDATISPNMVASKGYKYPPTRDYKWH